MRAADKLRSDQGVLRPEDRGVNRLQRIPPDVVVAVARTRREVCLADAVLAECVQHFHLVVFRNRINFRKPCLALRLRCLSER